MPNKLTKRQKFVHFLCYPILSFFGFYIVFSFFSFLFKGDLIMWGNIPRSLALAVGMSIGHWIDLFYPPRQDSPKEKKSIKQYFEMYVINGSFFNRLLLVIYALSVIAVIVVIWLSIIGYL